MVDKCRKILDSGSPQKWTKSELPKYLIKRFFISLIGIIIPFWGAIILLVTCRWKKERENRRTNLRSAKFGVNDSTDFDLKKSFRLIYFIVSVVICVVSLIVMILAVLLSDMDLEIEGKITILVVGIFDMVMVCVYNTFCCLKRFKYEIAPYACERCGWVNTQIDLGDSDHKSKVSVDVVGQGGGERYEAGKIYVDNQKVGSVYSRTSVYNIYQKREHIEYKINHKCSHCGYEYSVKVHDVKSIGEKYHY